MIGLLVAAGAVGGVIGAAMLSSGQCRKPHGETGRRVLRAMNDRHSGVTDWGLAQVRIGDSFRILDVGCGGGRTIQKMAALAPRGHVSGIDYSEASVAEARVVNQADIALGRVDVQQGSVSRLPFPDQTFDLVTAVETHYYWPNLVEDLREVRRVLKPGQSLVLIAETYRGQLGWFALQLPMMLLRAKYLTVDQHREAFTTAGFGDVTVSAQKGKGWICVVGKRPPHHGE
ncbi:MAG TPA: class I SAM-dependent methyltransferase [Gemmatimonadales bacterium]|nr:class I SAM-dependent methyltransferase [Gemmatimonadales bacterium]